VKAFLAAAAVLVWVTQAAVEGQVTATNLPPPGTPLATLDVKRIRSLAAEAIRQTYPRLDLNAFYPSYTIYMEDAASGAPGVVFAEWLGKEVLASEKGRTRDLDRQKVRKVRVRLAPDGRLLDVVDMEVWISRGPAAHVPASKAEPPTP